MIEFLIAPRWLSSHPYSKKLDPRPATSSRGRPIAGPRARSRWAAIAVGPAACGSATSVRARCGCRARCGSYQVAPGRCDPLASSCITTEMNHGQHHQRANPSQDRTDARRVVREQGGHPIRDGDSRAGRVSRPLERRNERLLARRRPDSGERGRRDTWFERARSTGLLAVEPAADYAALAAIIARYASLPCDYADATLIALAGRTGVYSIATIDRRDFSVYRIRGRKRFCIVLGG